MRTQPVNKNSKNWKLLLALSTLGFISEASNAENIFSKANSAFNMGHSDEAIALYTEALATAPEGAEKDEALWKLSQAQEKTLRIPEAIQTLKSLEGKQKKYPDLDFTRGRLHFALKQYPEALKAFEASEKANVRASESKAFRAYTFFSMNDFVKAKALYTEIEKDAKVKSEIQGAKLYLGSILFEEEKKEFQKNKFSESKKKFQETVDLDPQSDIGKAAVSKITEINAMLNKEEALERSSKKLSASVTGGAEYDTNILNENDTTANPTNATALRSTTIGNVKYKLLTGQKFSMTPGLTGTFSKHFAIDDAHQSKVKTSDAFVLSAVVDMSSTKVRAPKPPLQFAYPVKFANTFNDPKSTGKFATSVRTYGTNPNVRAQLFGLNYSTLGLDLAYNQNADPLLTTVSWGANANQTYTVTPKVLDTALIANVNITSKNKQRKAFLIGTSFTYYAPAKITLNAGVNMNFTSYTDTTRGSESLLSTSLSATRLFGQIFSVSASYSFESLASASPSLEYNKHKIGIKGTLSY